MQALDNKEFREAYDRQANAHNALADWIEGNGAKYKDVKNIVDELEKASKSFAIVELKLFTDQLYGKKLEGSLLCEIRSIEKQLSFKSLYSLLGCARGLLKAQNAEQDK